MQAAIAVPKACERVGLSRSKFYELLNEQEIPSIKVGRRRLVRIEDLDRWLASLPSQPPSQSAA